MRVFAISDLHVDYAANARWVEALSAADHVDDLLIVAGDVSHSLAALERTMATLSRRFRQVFFVPGNHDLWVLREPDSIDSMAKFEAVCRAARNAGASMTAMRCGGVTIVPLLSWYDYSFGEPSHDLKKAWMDFRACRWPQAMEPPQVTEHFLSLNRYQRHSADELLISFSHFLPRIDVMPARIPPFGRALYPVLGARALDEQIRMLKSAIHVYGHSHVNRRMRLDGTLYVNNALAYPHETYIASKQLHCIYEDDRVAA